MKLKLLAAGYFSLLACNALAADTSDCIQRAMRVAPDQTTIGEIRLQCQQNPDSFPSTQITSPADTPDKQSTPKAITVDAKRELEFLAAENPYGISPHRRNYMMPITYNRRPNGEPFGVADRELDQAEVKFQFSYKVPLMRQILDKAIDLHFAYTNQSYWQAFNGSTSRPFRETNHEPELFFSWTDPWVPTWVDHAQYSLGFSHQSNGRSGDFSRSWNRLYLSTLLQRDNYYLGLKIWDRIEDRPKEFPDDPRGDDNPDIEKFMGHFELEISRVNEHRSFSIMLRNNLRTDDNFGAIQLGYSFPLSKTLNAYVQYFEGYGESMIDYNHDTQRFGIGIAISDWP